MPISTAGKGASSQRGFSYAMVLAAVVIVGILAEAAHVTTWRLVKAERESELLFRGQAYRRAIESFYISNGRYPHALEDLVRDPGSASRRHLRALYSDPMGKGENKEWTVVRAKDGGVAGVASTSTEEPLKKANFPKGFENLAGAKSYAEWIFEYAAPASVQPPRAGIPAPSQIAPPVLKTF